MNQGKNGGHRGLREHRQEELPRERCRLLGCAALTDGELLAILLRTGTREKSVLELSEELLHWNPEFDGLAGLIHYSAEELQSISGIGEVKAMELTVVGEISRRIWSRKIRKRTKRFRNAQDVMLFCKEDMRSLGYEEIRVLYLDNQMQLIREHAVSRGTCNHSALSPRDIFIEAFRLRAVCMVLVHNHPSGIPEPSEEDIALTRELEKAGDWIGITLVDHIIIGDNCYYSFKEQGII
ncbi:MAG: RadC family protein [Oribacterium sp.]